MKTTARLLALAAFVGLGITTSNAASILSRGHTDIGIAFEGGAFDLHIHSEEYGLEFAPDEAVLRVLPSAENTIPADPAYSFLGTSGESTWILPQDLDTAESAGLLLLGFGAEEMEPADFTGVISVALANMVFTPEPGRSGSANFSVFTADEFGAPTVLMSTHDGIAPADVATVVPGSHQDLNWAFSAPGKYVVTFQVTGELSAGGTVSAGGSYTFVVKSDDSEQSTQLAVGEIIEVGGEFVQVSKVGAPSVGPESGGVSVVNFKPLTLPSVTVNSGNDSILAHIADYRTTTIAREGDPAPGIVGTTLKSFSGALLSPTGETAFLASLTKGTGGVDGTNDTVLFGGIYDGESDSNIPVPVLREGDAVPGFPTFAWQKVDAFVPGPGGILHGIAKAKDASANAVKTFLFRATPDEGAYATVILASTGGTIETDSGLHTIKTISRPTRTGQRPGDNSGGIEVLMGFTDKSSEVVRFAGHQLLE